MFGCDMACTLIYPGASMAFSQLSYCVASHFISGIFVITCSLDYGL
jgi:hypothetical protein